MHSVLWIFAGIVVLMIIASAFFSGSETALTAVHAHKIKGPPSSVRRVEKMLAKRPKAIGAVLLGNNVVNIFASALATYLATTWFGDSGVLYATIFMTVAVFVFGEITPKFYALKGPENFLLALAPLLQLAIFLLSPLVRILEGTVYATLGRGLGKSGDSVSLKELVEQYRKGANHGEETDILQSVSTIEQNTVEDAMTHRSKVVTLDLESRTLQKDVRRILAGPFSRIPLLLNDDIVGVLHVRALIPILSKRNVEDLKKKDLLRVAMPPWNVSNTRPILTQLREFRKKRAHMAVVRDLHNVFRGVLTLEDILEELVGDVHDEYDPPPETLNRLHSRHILNGTTSIREINRELGWELPEYTGNTINGFIAFKARGIPSTGTRFIWDHREWKILKASPREVERVEVSSNLDDQDA